MQFENLCSSLEELAAVWKLVDLGFDALQCPLPGVMSHCSCTEWPKISIKLWTVCTSLSAAATMFELLSTSWA